MYEKLKQQVLPQLIMPGARILVAVSGGPDSMALAHVLWRYAKEMKNHSITLVLTHVHHGVRKESDDEEKMVKKMARDWEIPCLIHHFDSKEYAKSVRKSFQTAAREWRYNCWQEDMRKENCTLLATAHHLGDQAETVLYRLLRGSGAAGLGGIRPYKGQIIRPLLTIAKEDILEYCRKEDLPYALDCSNEEPIYTRNKIRLQLIPQLQREYNPQVVEALGRLAELMRWDEEYIEEQVKLVWQRSVLANNRQKVVLCRKVFEQPRAILSRLIRKAVAEASGEPRGIGYSYVEQVMNSQGQVGWSQDLPGIRITIEYEGVCFQRVDWGQDNEEPAKGNLTILPVEAKCGEWIFWQDGSGRKWQVGLFKSEEEANCMLSIGQCVEKVMINPEVLKMHGGDLSWRHRQEGDSLWINGLGHKSLKKVFQDGKVAAAQRSKIPLLAMDKEIIWIPGIKQNDFYRGKNSGGIIGILKEV